MNFNTIKFITHERERKRKLKFVTHKKEKKLIKIALRALPIFH